MKPMLTLLLLWGISAWGQVCNHSDLAFIPTRCPCTGAILFVDECQGTFGARVVRMFRELTTVVPLAQS
jgi:hypothetical protein